LDWKINTTAQGEQQTEIDFIFSVAAIFLLLFVPRQQSHFTI
jgi:hypothetical protein